MTGAAGGMGFDTARAFAASGAARTVETFGRLDMAFNNGVRVPSR